MSGLVTPSIIPVSGSAFVKPLRKGDGLLLEGLSSGGFRLKPADIAGNVTLTAPSSISSGFLVSDSFGSLSFDGALAAKVRLGLSSTDSVTFGDLTVSNLLVNGTTTTINSTAGIHIVGFTPTLFVADQSGVNLFKRFQIVTGSYDESRVASIIAGQHDQNNNDIFIGGNRSDAYAATIIRFFTAANTTTVTGTERARLDSAGNFGIGTSAPAARLDIADTVLAGSGSLSGSVLNATQTWNTTGTPTAIKLNVTDTASNASSLLMDLQVGASRMRFIKTGVLSLTGGDAELQAGGIVMNNGTLGNTGWGLYLAGGSGNVNMRDTASLNWTSGVATLSSDLRLFRDAAQTLAQRNAGNAQTFRIYESFTDASNYTRGSIAATSSGFDITPEAAGTGSKRPVRILGHSLASAEAVSALEINQTWNTTGTPTLIKANVTDTASATGSMLLDLQVGGQAKARLFAKGGSSPTRLELLSAYLGNLSVGWYAEVGSTSGFGGFVSCPGGFMESATNSPAGFQWLSSAASSNYRQWRVDISSGVVKYSQGTRIEWYGADFREDLNASDLVIRRDAAGTLAQRNATNAQTFRIYNTFTDASNYERGKLEWSSNVLRIGTEKAGTGSARALELQTDGTTRVTIGTDGVATFATTVNFQNGSGSTFAQWNGPGRVFYAGGDSFAVLTSDGTTRLYNNGTLCWNTSANASSGTIDIRLKRASSGLFQIEADSGVKVRNLANTADADITAAHGTFSAGTDTVSTPILNLSQTWNNAATTFTGILANVTDTASNANSLLMDLQVGGSSRFSLTKNGDVEWHSTDASIRYLRNSWGSIGIRTPGSGRTWIVLEGGTSSSLLNTFAVRANADNPSAVMRSDGYFGFRSGTGTLPINIDDTIIDVRLYRDTANTLAQRNATNAQTFRIYNTFTDSSNYERLSFSFATYSSSRFAILRAESAGTGSANIGVVLGPKGTGAIVGQMPDGTVSGGNARGQNAVDLQTLRLFETAVASGKASTISGGYGNTSSGIYSTVGGGYDNLSRSARSTIAGGTNNVAAQKVRRAGSITASTNTVTVLNATAADFDNTTANAVEIRYFYNNTWTRITRTASTATQSGGNVTLVLTSNVGAASQTWTQVTVVNTAETDTGIGSTVGGGVSNISSGDRSTVGGGAGNTSSGEYNTVGGGYNNISSGSSSTVGGGRTNISSGSSSTVGGGRGNTSSGNLSTVGGGDSNTSSNTYSTVGGGYNNTSSGEYSTVGGGGSNISSNEYSTVGGGRNNISSGQRSTVGGGDSNTSSGDYSTVGGGTGNISSGSYSTVGGGTGNTSSGMYSTVGGGTEHTSSGDSTTVGGGRGNTSSGQYSTVGGGRGNTSSGYASTVGGGYNNTSSNTYSTVGGGYNNTSNGSYSTVGGGLGNTSSGVYSTVGGGLGAKATRYGETSHASGFFFAAGDAQHTVLIARRATTDATANVVLTLNADTPGSGNRLTLPAETTWSFGIKLAAYNDTDNTGAWWTIRGGVRRDAANGTAMIGSLIVERDSEGTMSGTSASIVADDTNEALEIRVTGLVSKNIRWVAVVDISQVSYGIP